MKKLKQEHTEVTPKVDAQLNNLAIAQSISKRELINRALKHYINYKQGGIDTPILMQLLRKLINTMSNGFQRDHGDHEEIEAELTSILDAQHGPSHEYGVDR